MLTEEAPDTVTKGNAVPSKDNYTPIAIGPQQSSGR